MTNSPSGSSQNPNARAVQSNVTGSSAIGSSVTGPPGLMPASSVGQVLQRGGEELVLEKVEDRVVLQPQSEQGVSEILRRVPQLQLSPRMAPLRMVELQVPAAARDQAMQQLRSQPGITYTSHLYRLKNNPGTLVYLTNQMTVQFIDALAATAIEALTQPLGLRQLKPVQGLPNTYVFEVTSAAQENPLKLANRLMQSAAVILAEPNVAVRAQPHYRPKDPLFAKQWHLTSAPVSGVATGAHVNVEKAWDITRGDRSVVVAVMDDAIDLNHPDFQGIGKIVAPRDFKGQDRLPSPEDWQENHGTACAGVAIAEENGTGAVGVAPGCALMPIRTTGFLDDEAIESLFDWAVERGAAVISCSWGPSVVYFPLSNRQKAALTRAATRGRQGKGCVIVFAAGNANRPTNGTVFERGWPKNLIAGNTQWLSGFAAHPDVITVSACTSLNRKAIYSNWGAAVSVCAPSNNAPPGMGLMETGYIATPPQLDSGSFPGLGIVTTDRVNGEGYDAGNFASDFGGTSSACPLVAGVAALVISANPNLSAVEVRQILQQSADKIIDPDPDGQFGWSKGTYETNGRCDWFGYGKVNAHGAVQMALKQAQAYRATRQLQQVNANVSPIPDADLQGMTSPIYFSETGIVQDIQVQVTVMHGHLGDLTLGLIAPSGRVVLLQGRTLGAKQTLQGRYTVQTTPLLRQLLGQPAQGNWQLQLIDHAVGDTGELRSWQLQLGV
jgi:subtilisin family serine protease/subtilisin-like proprotein convertase family protein